MSKKTRDFQFKQFNLKQEANTMKFGTDSAILGALALCREGKKALDIGAGTGVLSLMLAQRYPEMIIDAVEIDALSAGEAQDNFENSPWSQRLTAHHSAIQGFPEKGYDLIISNPPYFVNSQKSTSDKKSRVRHTDLLELPELLSQIYSRLNARGSAWIILPYLHHPHMNQHVQKACLFVHGEIRIKSFSETAPVRIIYVLGKEKVPKENEEFVIYTEVGVYTSEFTAALAPYYLLL